MDYDKFYWWLHKKGLGIDIAFHGWSSRVIDFKIGKEEDVWLWVCDILWRNRPVWFKNNPTEDVLFPSRGWGHTPTEALDSMMTHMCGRFIITEIDKETRQVIEVPENWNK